MPTVIKMWEVTGDVLSPVAATTLPQDHKTESELEGWIAADPQVIADGVMIIDRQRDIPGVGILDLLGTARQGRLLHRRSIMRPGSIRSMRLRSCETLMSSLSKRAHLSRLLGTISSLTKFQ